MAHADLVILGGGSGGYACALRAAELGKSVILIDKDKLGGTCLHRGCIPTKALLHAAEVADSAKESDAFGVRATFEGIDMPKVNEYRDGVVGRLYKGLQGLVKSRNVTFVEGTGRLVGPKTIEVNGEQHTGDTIVLATGSYARSLPGLEITGRIMTSDQALNLDYVPKRVIVLGGGVIGVEFASVWRSFGSEVTIVEGLPHLVPNEDEACSKALERAYRKRGIAFNLGVRFASATQDDSGVHVSLEDGTVLDADLLLVAVGRGPNTAGMGYEEQGIAMDRGWVLVDERLRTNVPGVYAVGDITPGLQLAHRGFQHGIFVAEEVAGLNPAVIADVNIPRVTYCEPEVASVGLTEAKAKAAGYELKVGRFPFLANGKAIALGEDQGLIKTIFDAKTGRLLGAHMVGAEVTELIQGFVIAMGLETTEEELMHTVFPHPTLSEMMHESVLDAYGRVIHM